MGTPQPGDAAESNSEDTPRTEKLLPDQQEDRQTPKTDASKDLFAIRAPKGEDLGFVFQTFIEGMYSGNSWLPEHISKESFWQLYRGVLDGLFRTSGVGCWVLCLSDDPDTVIGYLVLSTGSVHWVHVKRSFQGFGLAKRLLAHAGVRLDATTTVTHQTDASKKHLPEKWEFKPYLLF